MEEEFKQRNVHIQQVCHDLGLNKSFTTDDEALRFNTYVDEKHRVVYCQVQKAASSYWKRILQLIQNPQQHTSLYDISPLTIQLPRLKNMNSDGKKYFSDKFFRFTVVRDPYMRLFSGYMNKFFSLNIRYWSSIGMLIVRMVRAHPKETVGYNVTFTEFIKYIILSAIKGYGTDRHFSPIYEHCSPCRVKYDVIAKMDNTEEEFVYILSILGKKANTSVDMYTEAIPPKLKLHKLSYTLYAMKPRLQQLMPFFEAMKRVWRCLQIYGILGTNVSLPFTKENALSIDELDFHAALTRAYELSGDPAWTRQNYRNALIEAYSQVSVSDLLLLQQVVKTDCEMFGYNQKPGYIFNKTEYVPGVFRYFEDYP